MDSIKKLFKFVIDKFNFFNAFRIVIFLAMLLHILFFILFYIKGITFLVNFNIFSVILYIFIFIYGIHKNLILSTVALFVEVLIHAIVCSYFIGSAGGFYIYPLCLLPVTYFICVNIIKRDFLAHIICIIVLVSYQLTKLYISKSTAPYEHLLEEISNILYLFNTISACVVLVILVYAFLHEMRTIQIDLENKNEILRNIANIDPLTNLSNRRHMNEKIKKEIENANGKNLLFSVAIGDIDNFKNINDTYGHDCGDLILKSIADILIKNTTLFNIEVCRWGGEEFMILLREANLQQSKEICEAILEDIRAFNMEYQSENISVTMTIGCALFDISNNDINSVLKEADINLYKGKKSSKDCVII